MYVLSHADLDVELRKKKSLCLASPVCHPPGCASASRPSSIVQLREGGCPLLQAVGCPPAHEGSERHSDGERHGRLSDPSKEKGRDAFSVSACFHLLAYMFLHVWKF